ncbi:MAG: glycine zipper 2TM domain-containing protein [Gammaproteobacteria bacterium]|nr:glycine zipper 2TM domain-containing protein [Gammaproteobacteria bacterium]
MKKMIKMLWMTIIIGCSTSALASNQDMGTVIGGIAGGILGNNIGHGSGRTVATIGGAVVGSLVGNQMGNTADAAEHYRHTHCYPHSEWNSYQRPCHYYPPRYPDTFISRDGRLCRHSLLTSPYGDRIYATFCCYRMSPNGFCARWVSIN